MKIFFNRLFFVFVKNLLEFFYKLESKRPLNSLFLINFLFLYNLNLARLYNCYINSTKTLNLIFYIFFKSFFLNLNNTNQINKSLPVLSSGLQTKMAPLALFRIAGQQFSKWRSPLQSHNSTFNFNILLF